MTETVELGHIGLSWDGVVAHVRISHPARFNAMTRAMWRQLPQVFAEIAARQNTRCVVICGDGEHFCAGGDISEYPAFRFDEERLRVFHEDEVWGGLQAILACDVPVVASIAGNCMGAGVEMACCCDVRLASNTARFGAPIGKLGFPMAPREAQLVASRLGDGPARGLLLGAQVLPAQRLLDSGFLWELCASDALPERTSAMARTISALGPEAASLNKRTLRDLEAGRPMAEVLAAAYRYADSAEHREGVQAFLDKRSPLF